MSGIIYLGDWHIRDHGMSESKNVGNRLSEHNHIKDLMLEINYVGDLYVGDQLMLETSHVRDMTSETNYVEDLMSETNYVADLYVGKNVDVEEQLFRGLVCRRPSDVGHPLFRRLDVRN